MSKLSIFKSTTHGNHRPGRCFKGSHQATPEHEGPPLQSYRSIDRSHFFNAYCCAALVVRDLERITPRKAPGSSGRKRLSINIRFRGTLWGRKSCLSHLTLLQNVKLKERNRKKVTKSIRGQHRWKIKNYQRHSPLEWIEMVPEKMR